MRARGWKWCWLIGACLWAAPAAAQVVGSNASIAATSTSANVQVPASAGPAAPFVLLEYGVGASAQEIFYALGIDNTVAAVAASGATQSPALPAAGVCLALGPNSWIAAITATATATLRITRMTVCPPR